MIMQFDIVLVLSTIWLKYTTFAALIYRLHLTQDLNCLDPPCLLMAMEALMKLILKT